MATKKQIVAALEAAGHDEFSVLDSKAELEEAAEVFEVDVESFIAVIEAKEDTERFPNRSRYDNRSNRAHSLIGG